MNKTTKLALVYDRNGTVTIFPVRDIDHAVRLADAIADSDLFNDDVAYNSFDVCEYLSDKKWGDKIGDRWESEDGDFFEDYWGDMRRPIPEGEW